MSYINRTMSHMIECATYVEGTSLKVGTWINGKPLYRKIRAITPSTSGQESSFSLNDSDSTGIVKIDGYVARGSGDARLPLNFTHTTQSSQNCMAFAATLTQVNYRVPTDATSLVAIIYYTKNQ